MKKLTALVLALSMLLGASALAEEALEMSDVPGMTAPGVLPIVTEPVTLTIGIPTHTLVTDYEDNFMTKMIEEETGIDLEFVFYPSAETATVIDLALASGDELPDVIVYGFGDNTASYGAQGYCHLLRKMCSDLCKALGRPERTPFTMNLLSSLVNFFWNRARKPKRNGAAIQPNRILKPMRWVIR